MAVEPAKSGNSFVPFVSFYRLTRVCPLFFLPVVVAVVCNVLTSDVLPPAADGVVGGAAVEAVDADVAAAVLTSAVAGDVGAQTWPKRSVSWAVRTLSGSMTDSRSTKLRTRLPLRGTSAAVAVVVEAVVVVEVVEVVEAVVAVVTVAPLLPTHRSMKWILTTAA